MIRTVKVLAACAAALAAPAALAGDHAHHQITETSAVRADVVGLDGKSLGTAVLQDTPTGVLVTTDLKGLTAGEHGFHFHEKGICDAAGKFITAGGHFTAGVAMHGLMVQGGPHGGDMPNQHVGADGVLRTQVLNTGVALAAGSRSLKDTDGSALVIHAGADDYKSQPSGAAGDRIACAVISAPK